MVSKILAIWYESPRKLMVNVSVEEEKYMSST